MLNAIIAISFKVVGGIEELYTRLVCGWSNLDVRRMEVMNRFDRRTLDWLKAKPTRFRNLVCRLVLAIP